MNVTNRFTPLLAGNNVIAYLLAGYPTQKDSALYAQALIDAGIQGIEIGIPFSDPLADGSTIQQSHAVASQHGKVLEQAFTLIATIRATNQSILIVAMGYYNPIFAYQEEAYCRQLQDLDADGTIVVDLPLEHSATLRAHLAKKKLAWIPLITPTTPHDRINQLTQNSTGFIYVVSTSGTTGNKLPDYTKLANTLDHVKGTTRTPIAVGFGIDGVETAKKVFALSNTLVVGSLFTKTILLGLQRQDASATICKNLQKFAKDILALS